MGTPGIHRIKQLLVGGKSKAIGFDEVVANNPDLARLGVDPINKGRADLAYGFVALIIGIDAVGGVSEPDGVVGFDHHIVRAVQALALETVGQDSTQGKTQDGRLFSPGRFSRRLSAFALCAKSLPMIRSA
jgi:hypothetical protein